MIAGISNKSTAISSFTQHAALMTCLLSPCVLSVSAQAAKLDSKVEVGKDSELIVDGDFDGDGRLDRAILKAARDSHKDTLLLYRGDRQDRAAVFVLDGAESEKIFRAFAPIMSHADLSFYEIGERAEPCATIQPAIAWQDMTALQRHIAFFDLNGDGRITLGETFDGLRDLGLNPALALPAAIAINTGMATPTAGHPSLTIELANIEAGIHGSDSGLYGNDGEFVEERFDRWFQRWDEDQDGALNRVELGKRLYQEMDLFDLFGTFASGTEYAALYLVAAEDGKISKERLRGLYTGALFYQVAFARGSLGCRFVPDFAPTAAN